MPPPNQHFGLPYCGILIRLVHIRAERLEKTPKEMAYGMDVWVKSTDRMVINERYKRGKYHEDLGDGMDYYHVGFTLGAGNIAPMIKDSIYYDGTYARYKVLDNGPLRTRFQLEYNEWNAAGMKLRATKTITLDAGTHFNKVEVVYAGDTMAALPLVVGIIKRKEQGSMLLDELNGTMAYWEPLHGADGMRGLFQGSQTHRLYPMRQQRLVQDEHRDAIRGQTQRAF